MGDVVSALLQVSIDAPLAITLLSLTLALTSLVVMIACAVSIPMFRSGAIYSALGAVTYLAICIGLFISTVLVDAFALFKWPYLVSALIALPLALLAVVGYLTVRHPVIFGRLLPAAFTVWTICITVLHGLAVGAAAAGV